MSDSKSRKTYWLVTKQTFGEFSEDKCPRLGAALAYYTIFSIVPLLLIAVGMTGWIINRHNPDHPENNPIVKQVTSLVGGEGGKAIQSMVKAGAEHPTHGKVATIIGIFTLLFGASGVFGQLQDALNTIWEVAPRPGRGVWGFIRDRFLSFAMVAGVCFLLLVSLIISAALSAVHHFFGNSLPGLHYLWSVLNFVVSLAVVTLLFAMMYKALPDVKMAWRDVWIGALATAVLFTIGKWAIGMYLGRAAVASTYGAVGSLVVLLLWVYYSSQIFLLGAEFTQVYSRELGSNYVPAENAVALSEAQRAREGIPHAAVLEGRVQQVSGSASRLLPVAARVTKTQKESESGGTLLPATLGFAAGFATARFTGPKPKKLLLAPGVRVIAPPLPDRRSLWARFKRGWRAGARHAR
jgi:membrane protein